MKKSNNNFKPSERQYSRPQRQSDTPNFKNYKSPGNKFSRSGNSERPERTNKPGQFKKSENYREYSRDGQIKPKNSFNYADKPYRSAKKPYYKKDNDNRQVDKIYSKPLRSSKPVQNKYDDRVENKKSVTFEDMRETGSMTFGRNAVIELLKSEKTIDKIFVQSNQREGSITLIAAEAIKKAIPVIEVEKAKLDNMVNSSAHQGVVALTSEIEYCSVDDIIDFAESKNEKPFILIADKIMDAQNLGAIIRTAECSGVHGIIIPKRHAAGVSSVVNKISAGAVFHIKIAKVSNITLVAEDLKKRGVWIFASTSDIPGNDKSKKEIINYCDADYNLPLCLIVGNEGDGLSPIILQKSDFLINIPMYGKIESLNVSCAAAVLLYEIKNKRLRNNL